MIFSFVFLILTANSQLKHKKNVNHKVSIVKPTIKSTIKSTEKSTIKPTVSPIKSKFDGVYSNEAGGVWEISGNKAVTYVNGYKDFVVEDIFISSQINNNIKTLNYKYSDNTGTYQLIIQGNKLTCKPINSNYKETYFYKK